MDGALIAGYPAYDSYKDSGVEWLGRVPSSWALTRLGGLFDERKSKVSDKDFEALSVTKNGILSQLENAAKTNDGDNRKLVKAGDFVINSRSDRKGSSGVSPLNGSVSLINIVLKPTGILPEFCNHILKSHAFVEEYYRMGHGIVADLWTTRYDEMRAIIMALPSPEEQHAIAAFLDEKCGKLDEAVRIKEEQIALLRERRQILIQEAVTRGLNPAAPMKDSGIDWIGKVPSDWRVEPGRQCLYENKDKNTGMKESTVLSLSYGRVIVKDEDKLTGLVPESFETYQIVQPGDIIIRGTDLQNDMTSLRTGLAKNRGIITSAYINLRPKFGIDPAYLHYLLHSFDVQKVFYRLGSGLRQNLSYADFKYLRLPIPPSEDQQKIVQYIDTQNQRVENAIRIKEDQIAALKEYKTSLINAAVTGKIKVA